MGGATSPITRGSPSDSPNVVSKKAVWNNKIIVIWDGKAEFYWAQRLANACINLGWQCWIYEQTLDQPSYEKRLKEEGWPPKEAKDLIQSKKPDCVISLKWPRVYSAEVDHYFCMTGIFDQVFKDSIANLPDFSASDILKCQGILSASRKTEHLESFFRRNGRPFHSMEWYPSWTETKYEEVELKKVFYCGYQWDDKRKNNYRETFRLLANVECLDVYGPPDVWNYVGKAHKGENLGLEDFVAAMRRSGIVLILHADKHLEVGAPTARIFEAAAACCVIISDRHPFIWAEFGDSVLYVDHNQSGEALFEEIMQHYGWILTHPKEAAAMMLKAHSLASKFTLEKQLEAFKVFHLTKIVPPNFSLVTSSVVKLLKDAQSGHAESQNELAKLCFEGKKVSQNFKEAVYWLKKAAQSGHTDAQNNLGICYYEGKGVTKDLQEAVRWYWKAAETGHTGAQNNLGMCYYAGQGVGKDSDEAIKWFKKAAEADHTDAQNNLAICYYEQARQWTKKAADGSHTVAQSNLQKYFNNS